MERHLAAVLIADVVGYGRLSRTDEEGTRERFQADLQEIFEPTFTTHHGRLVKTMGDGMLVEFHSVVDAVRCAVELQQQKAERNGGIVPAEHRLDFRIGINLGDVIVEGDDIQGDGVNIADRMQALAEPGGIAISGTAYDHVKEKLPIGFASLGLQKVKSIAEPVRVYRVVLDPRAAGKTIGPRRFWAVPAAAVLAVALGLVIAWWQPWKSSTPPSGISAAFGTRPSLVVLPFDNLSDDKQQEYLANGFTEDLTTELARIPGLFVVSRNAAFAYKDKDVEPKEIADALGVRYLLEGSIRRVGEDMRINAQLIDGTTSGHLWAERFDGNWAEVFALQDKVVGSIAGALKLRLVSGAKTVEAGGTNNPEAYDAYLKGQDIFHRVNTPEEFTEAVKHFEAAVKLDPDFGAAYAQLAVAYWDADIVRAVVMGLSINEAYRNVYKNLRLAARNPSPSYYQLVADLLVREYRSDEAVTVLLKSLALDPSDPWNYLSLANALNFNGKPKEVQGYLDAAARVDPNSWIDYRHYQAGLAEFSQGKFEDAARSIEKMDFESPEPWAKFFAVQVLVSAYAHLGRAEHTASAISRLRKIFSQRQIHEPNQLITQDAMVFKNAADIERLLTGLTMAGVPELPRLASVGLDPRDRLTGTEIKALIFSHTTRGSMVFPNFLPVRRTTLADGAVSETVGTKTREGRSWVQGDFLCNAYPEELTLCGAIYRNRLRAPGRDDEFKAVYQWEHFEFSTTR